MLNKCIQCHKPVQGDEQYYDKQAVVCETCYMESRQHNERKTHWRYIRSIKVDYLQPPRK